MRPARRGGGGVLDRGYGTAIALALIEISAPTNVEA
jgi:hypothetical protein